MVAGHQRRAPGHAGRLRAGRPVRLRRPGDIRTRRARGGADAGGRADERGHWPRGLHLVARRERRVPGRPDRHAAGRRPVPRGDRRRDRDVGRQVDQRPPARRGVPRRPHLGLDHDRAVGAAGQGRAGLGDGRRRVARGVRVRHLPGDRGRRHRRARVADLLRRRARLGTARADRAGRPAVGRAVGGGPAARPGAGRHRRVRHDRAAGEGVPRVRRRAHPRLHAGRSGHDPAQGQGAGVHRQGGVPAAAGRAAVRGAVHAHRGLAHLGGRDAAVHARRRADPVPGGRAPGRRQGPAVVRDQRGLGPVGGQAPADGLPARGSHAVEGSSLLVEYMGEEYPVTVAVAGATPLFDPSNARIRS